MAKMILKEAFISVGGNDFSTKLKQVTIKMDKDIKDATAMTQEWEEALAGTKKAEITAQFFQDYDGATSVDAVLWAAFLSDAVTALIIRPAQASAGSDNPQFACNAHIPSYQPLGASKGDVVMAPVTFKVTGGITRTTS